MNSYLIRIIRLSFIIFLLFPSICFATDYYVSNGGSDGNTGLIGHPFASLWKAYDTAGAGDTIYLNRGDSWTVTVNRTVSEAAGVGLWIKNNNMTVDAYGSGALPIIDASAQTDRDDSKSQQYYSPIDVGIRYGTEPTGVTISNIDVRGPTLGLAVGAYSTGASLTISGITASVVSCPNAEAMITMGILKDNMTIQDSIINSAGCDHGIQIRGGDSPTISGNEIYNYGSRAAWVTYNLEGTVTYDGNFIHSPASASSNYPICFRESETYQGDDTATILVRNNIVSVVGATATGDNLSALNTYQLWDDNDFYIINNTFISDGNGEVEVAPTSTRKFYFYNNIHYDFATGIDNVGNYTEVRNSIFYSTTTMFGGTPDVNSNNVTTNPNLSNPSMSNDLASDADLTVSSTNAIDSGYGTAGSGNVPSDDYDGDARDDGDVDIGAFEYEAVAGDATVTATGSGVSGGSIQ